MKNLIINGTLILFALTICSFQTPNPTIQEIFQEALNIEALSAHLAKDKDGKILPLTLATNGLLSKKIQLSLNDKAVAIVNNATNIATRTASILELKEMKMKGKKSYLAFQYGEKMIKVKLKKEAGDWVAKTISVKWKKGFTIQTVTVSEKHF